MSQAYDAIYTANPRKWGGGQRDRFAFNNMRLSDVAPGAALLDIGCGNGHTLRFMSHYWKETALYGIDLSPVAISLAQAKLPQAHLSACALADYEPGITFDVILLLGVAEHFEDIPVHLRKVRELLSDGGYVYLEVPNCLAYNAGDEGYRPTAYQMEWHLKRDTWENIIRDSGFTIERSIRGPSVEMEFIWIITAKTESE